MSQTKAELINGLSVNTAAADTITVDSSGRVGINNASPQEILHVKAASETVSSRDGVIFGSTDSLAADKGLPLVWAAHIGTDADYGIANICGRKENATSDNGAGYLQFGTGNGAGAISEKMRIDSSGNLGLGTTSPSQQLTMASSGDSKINIKGHGSSTGYFIGMSSATDAQIYNAENGFLQFATNASERMRVTNDGNILIAQTSTTSPGQGNTTAGIALNPTGRGNFSGTNTAAMLVQRSNDGIAQLLYRGGVLQGNISVSSSGITFNSTSDYRLKENVVAISNGITRLKTLKPSRFNFIIDETNTLVDGFLAHEVTSAVPEAITGIKDAVAVQSDVDEGIAAKIGDPVYQTIDQSKLVPLLTAALQEEIAKREALETRVATLEAA